LLAIADDDWNHISHVCGAEVAELGAGDALYMPRLFWHGAIYREPSISYNLRFGRQPLIRRFNLLPRGSLLQCLLSVQIKESIYDINGTRKLADCLIKAFLKEAKSPKHRYRRFQNVVREHLQKKGMDSHRLRPFADNFDPELNMGREELEHEYTVVFPIGEDNGRKARKRIEEFEEAAPGFVNLLRNHLGYEPCAIHKMDALEASLLATVIDTGRGLPVVTELMKMRKA
jgi:ribosomal protein L16 Arg81 hydroxylase